MSDYIEDVDRVSDKYFVNFDREFEKLSTPPNPTKISKESKMLAGSGVNHRWDLPVLHYHEIMVIYPYPFLVVITQLFSWIMENG